MNKLRRLTTSLSEFESPDVYDAFARSLDAIWRADGKRRRMGVAVSGGVDSMALATLCRSATRERRGSTWNTHERPPAFTGFIVDHKLRSGSRDEARRVADELDRLGIESEILQLDWEGYRDPPSLPNLESVARRLRYRALGAACRDADITSLLVGHHADDQAETALIRLLNGYTGAGLGAIKSSVPLPECRAVYGVDRSGRPYDWPAKLPIEHGGVRLQRALLSLRKEQLIAVCKENGVRWFEDATNADPMLTVRNAARQVLRNESALPQALRQSRLCRLAEDRARAEADIEAHVDELSAQTPVLLDVCSGEAIFTVGHEMAEHLAERKTASAHLLRRMLDLVSPNAVISLQDLDEAIAMVFCRGSDGQRMARHVNERALRVQIAGVNIAPKHGKKQRDLDGRSFAISRALPRKAEQPRSRLQLWPYAASSTNADIASHDQWHLWDGRYWIRVAPPASGVAPGVKVVARLLNHDGIHRVRSMTDDANVAGARPMERLRRLADHGVRLTLPALFIVREDQAGTEGVESLVGLPSLGWYVAGWTGDFVDSPRRDLWRCEIRYKHVDLREDQVQGTVDRVNLR